MASQEDVDGLVRYGILQKGADDSLRCPSEDEKRQQVKNFLECIAGEPLPEGADPLEVLEGCFPGVSAFRHDLESQILKELQ